MSSTYIYVHGYSLYNIHMYPYLILSVAPYFALEPYKSDIFFLSTKPCQPTWNSKLGIINFFFLWKKSLFVEISSTTLILVFLNRSSLYCTKHKDLSIDLWYLFFCLVAGESEFSVENKHRIIFTNRILFMNKMNCLVRILVKERTNSHNLIVVNSVSV